MRLIDEHISGQMAVSLRQQLLVYRGVMAVMVVAPVLRNVAVRHGS